MYSCKHLICVLLISFFSSNVVANQKSVQKLDDVISDIYQAITAATTRFELGNLTDDEPYTHRVSKKVSLAFANNSYDQDLSLAFSLLSKLEKKRDQMLAKSEQTKNKSQQPKRQLTRTERLMQAELKMQKHMPAPQIMVTDYDVMSAFKETRQNRLNVKNKAAEVDMQMVVAERQAAEQQLAQEKQRKAALQQQAAIWQAEMDNQAVERANAIREWKKQNGFGAHMRKIFTGVLSAGIGSFTGSLTSTVSTNLANKAITKIFGDDAPKAPPANSYPYYK